MNLIVPYLIQQQQLSQISTKHLLTVYSSIIYVGTPTFRHSLGTNNFVYQDSPLGWYKGSDGQELSLGLNYFNHDNMIVSVSSGIFQSGEESILSRAYEPYKDYLKGTFPSGKVNDMIFFDIYFDFMWKKYLSFSAGMHWYEKYGITRGLDLIFSINLFHTFSHNS